MIKLSIEKFSGLSLDYLFYSDNEKGFVVIIDKISKGSYSLRVKLRLGEKEKTIYQGRHCSPSECIDIAQTILNYLNDSEAPIWPVSDENENMTIWKGQVIAEHNPRASQRFLEEVCDKWGINRGEAWKGLRAFIKKMHGSETALFEYPSAYNFVISWVMNEVKGKLFYEVWEEIKTLESKELREEAKEICQNLLINHKIVSKLDHSYYDCFIDNLEPSDDPLEIFLDFYVEDWEKREEEAKEATPEDEEYSLMMWQHNRAVI